MMCIWLRWALTWRSLNKLNFQYCVGVKDPKTSFIRTNCGLILNSLPGNSDAMRFSLWLGYVMRRISNQCSYRTPPSNEQMQIPRPQTRLEEGHSNCMSGDRVQMSGLYWRENKGQRSLPCKYERMAHSRKVLAMECRKQGPGLTRSASQCRCGVNPATNRTARLHSNF